MTLKLTINGNSHTLEVSPVRRLLDIIRDDLKITSVKEGCGEGECGACSVIMNDKLVNSCLVPAAQCENAVIVTAEAFAETERGRVLTESYAEMHSVQCGFCTPGMLLASEMVLRDNPDPTEEEIREGLSGNLCRCTGYDMIIDGVRHAAKKGKGLW